MSGDDPHIQIKFGEFSPTMISSSLAEAGGSRKRCGPERVPGPWYMTLKFDESSQSVLQLGTKRSEDELSDDSPAGKKMKENLLMVKVAPDIVQDMGLEYIKSSYIPTVPDLIYADYERNVLLLKRATIKLLDLLSGDRGREFFRIRVVQNRNGNWESHLKFHKRMEILDGVTDIDLVVNLKLREDVLVEKCLGRRICAHCGKNYNVACIDYEARNGMPAVYMAPLLPPPSCAPHLVTRSDDTEEVIRERLRIYKSMCEPVEEFYRSRGKLLEFNLPGGIPESWPKLLQALNLEEHEERWCAAA